MSKITRAKFNKVWPRSITHGIAIKREWTIRAEWWGEGPLH